VAYSNQKAPHRVSISLAFPRRSMLSHFLVSAASTRLLPFRHCPIVLYPCPILDLTYLYSKIDIYNNMVVLYVRSKTCIRINCAPDSLCISRHLARGMIERRSSRPDSPRAPACPFCPAWQVASSPLARFVSVCNFLFRLATGVVAGPWKHNAVSRPTHKFVKLRTDGDATSGVRCHSHSQRSLPPRQHHLFMAPTACRSRNPEKMLHILSSHESRLSTGTV
jgi:hypothetical protein